jgi:uncharacterized protein YbbC (DUF1343 family)
MFRGIDALVFDVQDGGVRFYTYITMVYSMEAAAQQHISFFVLDRPIHSVVKTSGPVLDRTELRGLLSNACAYAMTMGELAQMFNSENKLGADLHVVAMQDWHRRDFYDMTGLRGSRHRRVRALRENFLYPELKSASRRRFGWQGHANSSSNSVRID